jgi:hypothetical protein
MLRCLLILLVALSMVSMRRDVHARVTEIEIVEREPFAGGMSFGDVGPYEVIRGRLHFSIDPDHPRNRAIVDLHFARQGRLREDISTIVDGQLVEKFGDDPRNSMGEVQFKGDFVLLKPLDLSKGNHRLLYDVNNRGNLLMLSYYNKASGSNRPRTAQHAGDGWLMKQGYSLLWSAWNWDVEKVGQSPLRINLPIVVEQDGSPMTGRVNAELEVQSRDDVTVQRIAWGGSRCYPASADAIDDAVLTVRDDPDGVRTVIPREQWQFAALGTDGEPRLDPVHVYLPEGYEKGRLYELLYTAENSRVVGLGLAAVRDAIAFFHFESADDAGLPSPLAVEDRADPQYAYIFGISQSGRFITHMIYQGFHVDERDRLVFEGARPHVPGAGKGGFNYRFAQTTHHQKHLQSNYFPADHFPFHYAPEGARQLDPLGQPGRREGDVLAVAKRIGQIPRVMVSNHEGEYWSRSASLLHTDTLGQSDATLHRLVRIYMVNGARHGTPGRSSRRFSSTSEHMMNQLDPSVVGRALLVALDQWVSDGIKPPPSRVPRLDRGELVSPIAHRDSFPTIPRYQIDGLDFPPPRLPGVNLRPPRVDYGSRFWTEGIQDNVPPAYYGPRFATLVPAIDGDGNPLGGIRLPRLEVPLGTYQGFNPRRRGTGAENYLKAFDSSFWPLATTRSERLANGDPRLSIEERYVDQAEYVKQIKNAANKLRDERFLLDEDAEAIVDFARKIAWPPKPIDRWPFWAVEE